MNNSSFSRGIFFSCAGFTVWGFLPLYWKLLTDLNPLHILCFRIFFSLLLVGAILLIRKDFAWITVFREKKKSGLLILTAIALSFNWGFYIWAVNSGHTIEASMGYYMNPLVSIVLGLVFFREKLRPLQWIAFGIAGMGVLVLTVLSGTLPLISVTLAFSFGIYGLLKKTVQLPVMENLGAETLAAAPLGLFLFFFRAEFTDGLRVLPNWQGLSYLAELPRHTWIILAFCGLVSALPIYLFTAAAKSLPLSTLGFTQFLSPTIQFLLGFFVFNEYFPKQYFIAFVCIWIAVILYIVSISSRRRTAPETA